MSTDAVILIAKHYEPKIEEIFKEDKLKVKPFIESASLKLRQWLFVQDVTAYYYNGSGQQSIRNQFWASNEADGCLEHSKYWPWGRPQSWHENRPSYDILIRYDEIDVLLNRNPNSGYKTGVQGRPSSRALFESEYRRRRAAGECETSLRAEASYLESWLQLTHPESPRATAKTIENTLRDAWRSSLK